MEAFMLVITLTINAIVIRSVRRQYVKEQQARERHRRLQRAHVVLQLKRTQTERWWREYDADMWMVRFLIAACDRQPAIKRLIP
jgi:hypothetical protein